MNARVSRLLRSWSHHSGISRKSAKRAWNLVPRSRRGKMRVELEQRMGKD